MVGRGDRDNSRLRRHTFPVTGLGRALGVVTMVLGIVMFSALTAQVTAFIIARRGDSDSEADDEVLERLERIEASLAALAQKRTDA